MGLSAQGFLVCTPSLLQTYYPWYISQDIVDPGEDGSETWSACGLCEKGKAIPIHLLTRPLLSKEEIDTWEITQLIVEGLCEILFDYKIS